MDSLMDAIGDFIRVRQLNIAVAALLTLVYLVYQYWGTLKKMHSVDTDETPARISRSRSRSMSRSRSRSGSYKAVEAKRRGRKPHRRCSHCSLCNDCNYNK